jgi:hypothetical protein
MEVTARMEVETTREVTRTLATGASKEKETTLAPMTEVEKEAEPSKEATRIPTIEASKEVDATLVPTTEAKDKGKEKTPSPSDANPEV